jgi:hypothetical protein
VTYTRIDKVFCKDCVFYGIAKRGDTYIFRACNFKETSVYSGEVIVYGDLKSNSHGDCTRYKQKEQINKKKKPNIIFQMVYDFVRSW